LRRLAPNFDWIAKIEKKAPSIFKMGGKYYFGYFDVMWTEWNSLDKVKFVNKKYIQTYIA
jgi:hypothetical protein